MQPPRPTPGSVPRPASATLDAPTVRTWLTLALEACGDACEEINSLNIFPVPDLDTGSNVLLTLTAAEDALSHLPAGADAAHTTRTLAEGALRGARGNSGLLISQALAALAEVAGSVAGTGIRPVDMVHALEDMATSTWQAVSRPVEGTLLTVASDAAASAREILDAGGLAGPLTLTEVCGAASLAAQESVVETAGLGHGVVDAGAAAFMLLLTSLADAAQWHAEGQVPTPVSMEASTYTSVARRMLSDLVAGGLSHIQPAGGLGEDASQDASTGEFEVMYLLEATAAEATQLRHRLETIGDCVGVVGVPDAMGVGLYQVHVHTDTPRSALPRRGHARQVCVHHLHPTAAALTGAWDVSEPPLPAQHGSNVISLERLAARRRHKHPQEEPALPAPSNGMTASRARGVGVVACTRAPGLMEQLARTGVVVVLDPTREGIVRAVGDLGVSHVLVLPCDADSAMVAHEAARYLTRRALPTSVAPAGTSTHPAPAVLTRTPQLLVADTDDEARVLAASVALAASEPDLAQPAPLEGEGTSTARGAASDIHLARLAQRASLAGAGIRTMAFSGAGAEPEEVAAAVAGSLRGEDTLVTVITGRDALPDVGALTLAAVAQRSEELTGSEDTIDAVVHAGGQASPDVLVAVRSWA